MNCEFMNQKHGFSLTILKKAGSEFWDYAANFNCTKNLNIKIKGLGSNDNPFYFIHLPK